MSWPVVAQAEFLLADDAQVRARLLRRLPFRNRVGLHDDKFVGKMSSRTTLPSKAPVGKSFQELYPSL